MSRWLTICLLLSGCAEQNSGPAPIAGQMRYVADAALFAPCGGGAPVPIAMEGAYLALEQAYLATVHSPAEPIHIEVSGRYEARPPMEGPVWEHLIVKRVLSVERGGACRR
ncbi:MAG: hypothetical protein AAF771_10005 [Pseudomonadota bacterium]